MRNAITIKNDWHGFPYQVNFSAFYFFDPGQIETKAKTLTKLLFSLQLRADSIRLTSAQVVAIIFKSYMRQICPSGLVIRHHRLIINLTLSFSVGFLPWNWFNWKGRFSPRWAMWFCSVRLVYELRLSPSSWVGLGYQFISLIWFVFSW